MNRNQKISEEQLAKEADRLVNDLVLNHAIQEARTEHLERMSTIDPADFAEMVRTQAVVTALDDVMFTLQRYILADDNYKDPLM